MTNVQKAYDRVYRGGEPVTNYLVQWLFYRFDLFKTFADGEKGNWVIPQFDEKQPNTSEAIANPIYYKQN